MFNILVAGDKFFNPMVIEDHLKGKFGDRISVNTILFDYPVDNFKLNNETKVPTGMSWDDPNVQRFSTGVREFYGDPSALDGRLKDVDVLIIHGAALPDEIIQQGNRLKAVIILRGGPINVDAAALKRRNIMIYNTLGKNKEGVAEYAIGLLLSFLRNITESSAYLKNGVWKPSYYEYERTGIELYQKTFGIIGLGQIGRHLSRILKGFGTKVLAYDPFVNKEIFDELGISPVSLENLLQESDFISLHARNVTGQPIINRHTLSIMNPHSVLINTARGDLVDHIALKEALEQKRIRGAVLDVLGEESFGFYKELLALPNVLVTPHLAGGSQETVHRGIKMALSFLESLVS
ncbi:hypothetical protein LLE49_25670 [Alicyclobacillus tolerans]|uniref:NAD(P)-dependent oxidoreductase n=1 Tax=Alicyclobacillus tolerans TaxID=90970 RepID=UPI001F2220B9|nr:NAD(P)-dependent oxidoreductase [Alicyclobacillus tolerans]MCF8568117.1 hypothetical protein [Alicyclobacillus tolerans]